VARRDPDDPGRKKSLRENEQKQDEELEQLQEQERDRQQDQQQTRDAAQDALGNQAVQEMLGVVSAKAGEAGQGADLAERKDTEAIGVDYGGDDVPADAPITMEDLVRSWNPTTARGQDKDPFREGTGTEDLPPPDPALVEALGPLPPLAVRDAVFLSAEAAALDPGGLVRTAVRLAHATPLARCVGFLAAPARGALVDRRVVVVRARALAFAALLAEVAAESAPAEQRAELRSEHRFLLEVATRRRVLPELLEQVAEQKLQLPMAAALVAPGLSGLVADTPSGRSPSVEQIEHLKATLLELAPRVGAGSLVPELPPAAPAAASTEDDDPLGIDAILADGFTVDPLGPQYDQLLAAAEKLAVACTKLRVEAAGAILVVASVLGSATSATLARRAAAELDAEAARVLQLLVEIARAIQQRAVPPAGVRNGLRRAAKGVDLAWNQLCAWLSGVVSAVIPPPAALALPPLPVDDALGAALSEGRADDAHALLSGLQGTGVAARLLVAPVGPDTALECHRVATLARAEGRPALARLIDLWALLGAGSGGARLLGQALRVQQEAFQTADDLSFAVVTHLLLDLTARSRPDRVRAQHLEACRRLAPFGPTAGLALLSRWVPPDEPEGA
jgi:hypothetical protein